MVYNKLFFDSKMRIFSDQSSVNRTDTVHGTLRFMLALTYRMEYV